MKPFIFSSITPIKSRLRDYVIDLNRDKNLNSIIDYFYELFQKKRTIPKNSNDRINELMLKIHKEKEMKKIIEINLNRLNINFSNTEQDAISGNEWYIFDTPDSWEEAYREWMDDVGEDDNPDNIPNESEREQLNKLDNEEAYS